MSDCAADTANRREYASHNARTRGTLVLSRRNPRNKMCMRRDTLSVTCPNVFDEPKSPFSVHTGHTFEGVALKARDRNGVVPCCVLQPHLCATREALHNMYSPSNDGGHRTPQYGHQVDPQRVIHSYVPVRFATAAMV